MAVWAVAGLAPRNVLCDPDTSKCFRAMEMVENATNDYDKQYMFTVYVHPPPSDEPRFPADSVFVGREIAERYQVRSSGPYAASSALSLLQDVILCYSVCNIVVSI